MGYNSTPQYREPLMMEGGGDGEAKKKFMGIEEWDKCCFCIPLETGMMIITIFSWCNAIGAVLVALLTGAASAVATGAVSADSTTVSYATNYCSGSNLDAAQKRSCAALKKA